MIVKSGNVWQSSDMARKTRAILATTSLKNSRYRAPNGRQTRCAASSSRRICREAPRRRIGPQPETRQIGHAERELLVEALPEALLGVTGSVRGDEGVVAREDGAAAMVGH